MNATYEALKDATLSKTPVEFHGRRPGCIARHYQATPTRVIYDSQTGRMRVKVAADPMWIEVLS